MVDFVTILTLIPITVLWECILPSRIAAGPSNAVKEERGKSLQFSCSWLSILQNSSGRIALKKQFENGGLSVSY